ncbi:MAG: DUF4350 domain-containing protein [Flavobacteriales bacterium]|nr:DUF4350 domain-containing protein [Flavobacteriales bacterium]
MRTSLVLLGLLNTCGLMAQQVADPGFRPVFSDAAFPPEKGAVVAIDEAHGNFHTRDGRYQGFTRVAEADGHRVRTWDMVFAPEALNAVDVLVIANALHPSNAEQWALPTPSAFTDAEVSAVRKWVESGGALLLLADHMPFAGAASELAEAFGFTVSNCFAMREPQRSLDLFTSGQGLLAEGPAAGLDTVATFTGSAFRLAPDAHPLLELGPDWTLLEPDTAWSFSDGTSQRSGEGWVQGAALELGQGRMVLFGEAAMFSAQLAGPERKPVGMNHPQARGNVALLRGTLRWLTRR